MLELHYEGQTYALKDNYTISEVFDTMQRRAQGTGSTYFMLRDGGRVHLTVDEKPRFAVKIAEGYDEHEEALEAARSED